MHNKDPRREAGVVCDQLTLRIVQCSSTQDEPTVSRISATLSRRAHPVAYGRGDKVGTALRAGSQSLLLNDPWQLSLVSWVWAFGVTIPTVTDPSATIGIGLNVVDDVVWMIGIARHSAHS